MEGKSNAAQYYVAVSNNNVKLSTLVDLLLALLARGPLGLIISCGSRDALDTLVGGLRASLPPAEVHVLHSDLATEEFDSTLEDFARKLPRLQEPQKMREKAKARGQDETPMSRNYLQEAVYGTGAEMRDTLSPQRASEETATVQGAGKERQPTAQVLIATDICFKYMEAHQIPSELALLINYDLPIRKEIYFRQLQLFGSKGGGPDGTDQRIIVFFLVAGEIAAFRAFESLVPGPSKIDVMPVHVSDIFTQNSDTTDRRSIYDPIAKGQHSTVYKGRWKKSIHYCAIKSVDKSQKHRVLQEVRNLHALDHANILKFYEWYETTNHMWLVLEYCVGGDLMSLLRSDQRLPEASVHDFGRNLAISLHYLHTKSVIYCDLKPSNVLLDENGSIKLGGFGLSRKLADINDTTMEKLPAAKRGTPSYMAPELFQDGATHSTASDLWALGCVLYECSAGRPPFASLSFNELVMTILNADPPPLEGASLEFADLVTRLLDKNPATRMSWAALCNHPFWQVPIPQQELAEEPMLARFIARYNLAPPPEDAADSRRSQAVCVRQSTVNVMRLSRIVKRNLEKETADEEYSAKDAEAGQDDVHLRNPDAEVDFEEGNGNDGSSASANGRLDAFLEYSARLADLPLRTVAHSRDQPAASTSGRDAGGEGSELLRLLWHTSDHNVKPIMPSKIKEDASDRPPSIPSHAMTCQELLAAPPSKVAVFLSRLKSALAGPAPAPEKVSTLIYMETLCVNHKVANLLIDSPVAGQLVELLANASLPNLQARAASTLGLLVRHASEIDDAFCRSGVVRVLTKALEKSDKVKRKTMATLGELLFFIASQEQGAESQSRWQVPAATIDAICNLLAPNVDEDAQHYALKTINNVARHPGIWAERFARQSIVDDLARITASSGVQGLVESQVTAASCLCRLLRYNAPLLSGTPTADLLAAVHAGLASPSAKMQAACLNILCLALLQPPGEALTLSEEEEGAVVRVLALVDSPQVAVQGKALISLAALFTRNPGTLPDACSPRLLQQLDRLQRSGDGYVTSALGALCRQIAQIVTYDLSQICSNVRSTSANTDAEQHHAKLEMIQQLLGCMAVRPTICSPQLLQGLVDLLKTMMQRDLPASLKVLVVSLLESVFQQEELVAAHGCLHALDVIPALAAGVTGMAETIEMRFMCMRLLCDAVPLLLAVAAAQEGDTTGTSAEEIEELIEKHVLPGIPAALTEEEPMPLNALKLVAALLECKPSWVEALQRLELVPVFMSYLDLRHPNNRVHTVCICCSIVRHGSLSPGELHSLRVLRKALEILQYAIDNGAEVFLEPIVDLCRALVEQDEAGSCQGAPGAGFTEELALMIPQLIGLRSTPAAAQCVELFANLYPDAAAASLLSSTGAAALTDALQRAPQESAELGAQQSLLMALGSACRADPASVSVDDLDGLLRVLERRAELQDVLGGMANEAAERLSELLLEELDI